MALLCNGIVFAQTAPNQEAILTYQNLTPDSTAQNGEPVSLNTVALTRALPASELLFIAPNGVTYTFVTDRNSTSATGIRHWVAHLKDKGDDYRALVSLGQGIAFGTINTPDGNFRLHMQNGQLRLVDIYASERRTPIFHSPPLIAPSPRAGPTLQIKPLSLTTNPTPQAADGGAITIDLLVLYTTGLANTLGAEAVQARIEHLVALANQAYIDSNVNLQLRLVHSEKISYSDQASHDAALHAITDGTAPFNNVANLRQAYGADLVTLLKQKDSTADKYCGLAWGLGYNGATMNPDNAYSVVSIGDDVAGTNIYCNEYTLAHELGHNMGSAHDRANADSPGAYPYSYGYGIEGRFGDIMSYINPTVGKFSNPAVICSAQNDPCGVSENNPTQAANNALSLNKTSERVAAFHIATGLDTTPDNLAFTTLTGVTSGASIYSEVVTISGISTAAPIAISGGEYSINGGPFTSVAGLVSNGQTIQIKLQASSTAYSVATAMVTVGTITRAFRGITAPAQFTNTPAVSAGFAHSLALRADGTVWAWGDNILGSLGNGTTTNQPKPVQVPGMTGVVQITSGGDTSLALKSDGTVWGWGNNKYKQAGTSTSDTITTAQQITGLSAIKQVAAGYFDAMAIDASGQVWYWGMFNPTPEPISAINNASAIAAGNDHRMVLLQDGTVRVWGKNSSGQLGNGSLVEVTSPITVSNLGGVKSIAAGESHSLALRADGTVWAWGNNTDGQLGDGTTTTRTTPVAVLNELGTEPLGGVVYIAAGMSHSMAVKTDGSVVVWGNNKYSQLGDGTTANKTIPVKLALAKVSQVSGHSQHTLAIQNDGTVWAWGLNNQGNLGDGTTDWRKTPVAVGATASAPYWWIGQTDMEPSAWTINTATAEANSTAVSQALTVAGVNQSTPISILGGQYSINDGAFTANTGTVNAGQTVKVRITAPATAGASNNAWLTIGGVTTIYTITAAAPTQITADIGVAQGWNLLGNGLDAPLKVATALSDPTKVLTAWKWLPASNQWAFYAPSLSGQAYTDYLTAKGYAALDNIDAGDGFWVNAKAPFTISHSAAKVLDASQLVVRISKGWNLLTVGDSAYTPKNLNQALGNVATTLWVWDNPLSQWYFYAPSLDAAGTLSSYAQQKNYLDFVVNSKHFEKNVGFWLNN